MRARVIKHAVDGVAIGGVVELIDNVANRALIAGGVVESLEALPPEPPAKAFRPSSKGDLRAAEDLRARFDIAWEGAQEQIRSLREALAASQAEAENLRAALLSVAPSDPEMRAEGRASDPEMRAEGRASDPEMRAEGRASDPAPARVKKGG